MPRGDKTGPAGNGPGTGRGKGGCVPAPKKPATKRGDKKSPKNK